MNELKYPGFKTANQTVAILFPLLQKLISLLFHMEISYFAEAAFFYQKKKVKIQNQAFLKENFSKLIII